MKLWLVCEYKAETDKGRVWEFCGIYDVHHKAVEACHEANFGIALVEVNAEPPRESHDFPRCYYPLLEPTPEWAHD